MKARYASGVTNTLSNRGSAGLLACSRGPYVLPNPELTQLHSRQFEDTINWLSAVKTGPVDFDPVRSSYVKPNTKQTDHSKIRETIADVSDYNSSCSRH